MTAPRVEIDLNKIRHNARSLVGQLTASGIGVTGVTKAVCGHPAVARAMLDGGVVGLADARVRNVEQMREADVTCPITMIRTPMPSQAEQISQCCGASYNTEIKVILGLAAAARSTGTRHGIILMVEMGDLREGIMPADVTAFARIVMQTQGVDLKGIGANFACLNGAAPQARTMAQLSALAVHVEEETGARLEIVSGGNSANLAWALAQRDRGCRVNDLRLGEAILLGMDPVSGKRITGLFANAFTLIAEVIETKVKSIPAPESYDDLRCSSLRLVQADDPKPRSILGIGQQDTDAKGLRMPDGVSFSGATSDHLVVVSGKTPFQIGSEVTFQMNYSALMRAMSAPDVAKVLLREILLPAVTLKSIRNPCMELV